MGGRLSIMAGGEEANRQLGGRLIVRAGVREANREGVCAGGQSSVR